MIDVTGLTEIEIMRVASRLDLKSISANKILTSKMWRDNCGAKYRSHRGSLAEEKMCTNCKKVKKINTENFRYNRSLGRFRSDCIECKNRRDRRDRKKRILKTVNKNEENAILDELMKGNGL